VPGLPRIVAVAVAVKVDVKVNVKVDVNVDDWGGVILAGGIW
jgi:hypothetical protein